MSSVPALRNESNSDSDESFLDRSDFGQPDSFRYNILTWVLSEQYDAATESLRKFIDDPSEYPDFKEKVERFANHSIDLVYAIKAKRNFPGMSSLTRSKQQELRERFKEHFKELKWTLKKIEKIQHDLRIQDVRSTIYVVRAGWYAAASLAVVGFSLELMNGLGLTAWIVVDDILGRVTLWIADLVGL